jgi:hypothetical protein
MITKQNLLFLLALLFLYCDMSVYAYDDKITHPELTLVGIKKSNLRNVLKNNLGVRKELDQKYYNKTIPNLIQDGSQNEDIGFRARNHFWNPIHNEGLHDHRCGWFWNNDNPWAFQWWDCWNFTGLPNRDWAIGKAQDGPILDDCGDGNHSRDDDCNDYSWRRARQTYHEALIGTFEQMRDYKFAVTYEKIGRILHLLEDMGVPAHTRNDMFGHLDFTRVEPGSPHKWMGNLYEFWVKKKLENERTYIENISQSIIIPEFVMAEDYWDKEIYDGAFPGDTLPENGTERCGLAEYSNANFLSKGAMFNEGLPFGDDHYFPYPAKSSVENMPPEEITAEDGKLDEVLYLRKNQDGETVERLALARYFRGGLYLRLASLDIDRYYRLAFTLDDKVHESYADKLIPKTVAYTTGLINYFFRGTIEISDFEVNVDYPSGHHATPVGFNKVTIYAKNSSPESETMDAGTVHLVVKYKVDEKDGYLALPAHPSDYQYITVPLIDDNKQIISDVDIPSDEQKQFDFDLSDTPIPLCAKEIYFFLVYRGQLGHEADGIGVGYVPFTEFRTVDVSLPDEGVYALSDLKPENINPTAQGFDSLKFAAKNIDPNGLVMPAGTIQAIVKYRLAPQNPFQNPPPDSSNVFHYIVKTIPAQSIPIVPSGSSNPAQFTLDLSDAPIPLWATDIYLYLVYNGQIDDDPCKAAVGFKDISEPTPIAYYNCMDKICMYGDMVDAGDEALAIAISHGMQNQWDVYPHDRSDVYIRYSSIDTPRQLSPGSFYNYKIPYQAAGEFTTLYILSDYEFALNSSDGQIVATDSRDTFDHYGGNYVGAVFPANAIKNQIQAAPPDSPYYNPDQTAYIRFIPVFNSFRDIENSWLRIGLANQSLPENHPDNVNCQY